MKKFIFIVMSLLLYVGITNAQSRVHYEAPAVTLTNADTNDFALSSIIYDRGDMNIHMRSDSVSGSTDGTFIVQYTLDPSPEDLDWMTDTTFTINGPATQVMYTIGNFPGYKVRVRAIQTAGPQVNNHQVDFNFKRSY